MNAHPTWCGQDHRCTAHTMPTGEHASRPEVWKTDHGRVIATRYLGNDGRGWVEIRTVTELDGRENVAQAQCRHLLSTAYLVLQRIFESRKATATKQKGTPSVNSSLKAAALRYAAKGWPVFLLGRSKRPVANCPPCTAAEHNHDRQACPCLTCHGLYAATLEPKRITAMFTVVPSPMLAIRTGLASRLVVVDVDPGHGGEASLTELVEQGLCPPTALVRTGSGGLHLYYRHPGTKVPCSQSRLGPGIDVRGDGGYVVAAPSVHPLTRKPYEWSGTREVAEMPSALTVACQPTEASQVQGGLAPSTYHAEGITSPQRLLDALLGAVTSAPEGKRRTVLYGASRGVARMVAAGALSHNDALSALTGAGRAAQQTERDIRKAITDAFQAEGVTA